MVKFIIIGIKVEFWAKHPWYIMESKKVYVFYGKNRNENRIKFLEVLYYKGYCNMFCSHNSSVL